MTTSPLRPTPSPVGVSWTQWRDPETPERQRPVLVLSSGSKRVFVGPDDADHVISAIERMQNAWEADR